MLDSRKLKTSLIHLTLLLSTSLSLSLPRKVAAQVVFVDGRLLQGQELAAFKQRGGNQLPPGNYQINTNTGLMNYEGPMGQAVFNLHTGQYVGYGPYGYEEGNIYQNHQQSSSSRGNVRSHGSNGGASGWGHYASDGKCTIVSMPGMSATSPGCD